MIRRERHGPVLVLSLDRAEKRNALTPAMLARLYADVESVAADVRAVVLAGEGSVFCAGFDLRLCAEDGEALTQLLTGLSDSVAALRRCPAPVVAAAHGAAIAGGCALLGGADVVVTDRGAKMGYPVVRLGISPAVSAPFLQAAIGWGAARARLLDPGLIDGERAVELGLAHECVERAEEVRDRAIAIATALAEKPTSGVRATKQWLNELDGALDVRGRGLAASLAIAGSEEQRGLLTAALEGRG